MQIRLKRTVRERERGQELEREEERKMNKRISYLKKWHVQSSQKMSGSSVLRVCLVTLRSLHLLL